MPSSVKYGLVFNLDPPVLQSMMQIAVNGGLTTLHNRKEDEHSHAGAKTIKMTAEMT